MILLVDDRPENLFSLQKTLEQQGFTVDTANSGEAALRKVLQCQYALIILDVQMPDMDGFEVAEALSGSKLAGETPILFLSAVNTDKKFIARGYTSGAVDYITKPVDPEILLLKVKTFYKLSEQRRALHETQESLRAEIEMRKAAQAELAQAHDGLEQTVAERTRELLEKNAELELRNHELQQFAWVASHDLKEPLRKIQIFNSLVRDRIAEHHPDILALLDRTIGASQRMSQLISDLLDYSRLSVEPRYESTDLKDLIFEILADLEPAIEEKHAAVEVDPLPVIEAAPSQLRQVFQNLISNSLKFTRPGVKPVIHISAQTVAEKHPESLPNPAGGYCRIEVRDNGMGFDEQYLDRIFVLFQRLHDREAFEGTGIGLSIAKKIVEKHNGVLTARSEENVGSSFIVVLPLSQNPPNVN